MIRWNYRAPGLSLIQVVPRCVTEPNGVANYALALARALRAHGINTIFLSCTPSVAEAQGEWKSISLPKRQAQCLVDTIRSLASETEVAAVLLHFSGYGYEKRGVPVWLVQGLRVWRRQTRRAPLLTIFHELYATGRPWQSSYWLSPVQKLIACSILNMSSEVITPTTLFRRRLLYWNGDAHVTCAPVFSNIGEPGCGLPPGARGATAVVFGLAGVETRMFGLYRSEVERVVRTLEIKELIDVGPRNVPVPDTLAGVPLISKGNLPQHEVSELLQQARFGFVVYPLDVLGKSGAFAAYAAHGAVPVVFPDRRGSFEGLEAGEHFLDGLRLQAGISTDLLALIQRQLFAWYKSHSLQAQACFIQKVVWRDAIIQLNSAGC